MLKSTASSLMVAMELDEADFQRLLDSLAEILEDLDVELSELAQALLSNNTGQLERLLRHAATAAQVQNIQRSFQEGRYSHSVAQTLGLAVVYALVDEAHQIFVPSRTPSLVDSCIDSFGAAASQVIVYLRHLFGRQPSGSTRAMRTSWRRLVFGTRRT
jgi:hypothetical protein